MALTDPFTVWVCEDCYLTHHGYSAEELGHDFDPETDGPLSLVEVGAVVTDGLMAEDHDNYCDGTDECGCHYVEFATAQCDGCASRLAGSRHGMTFWSVTR